MLRVSVKLWPVAFVTRILLFTPDSLLCSSARLQQVPTEVEMQHSGTGVVVREVGCMCFKDHG